MHEGRHPWIGLKEDDRTGKWIWASDDSTLNYSRWGNGEPNNWNGVEDCGNIRNDKGTPYWNDGQCSTKNNFICEKNWLKIK